LDEKTILRRSDGEGNDVRFFLVRSPKMYLKGRGFVPAIHCRRRKRRCGVSLREKKRGKWEHVVGEFGFPLFASA